MNRGIITLAVIGLLAIAGGGVAQTQPSFDLKKTNQELEIMKGILQTTLTFVTRELQSSTGASPGRHTDIIRLAGLGSNIHAYYVPGQGAIFLVPTSSMRNLLGPRAFYVDSAVAPLVVGVSGRGVPRGEAPGSATVTMPPTADRPAKIEQPQSQKDLRKKLEEAQAEVKKRREEAEKKHQELMQNVSQIQTFLIEALANHGDSLTQVKSGEYISIILSTGGRDPLFQLEGDSEAGHTVISVQKSTIGEYKAGRLTLDQFKQRVTSFTN